MDSKAGKTLVVPGVVQAGFLEKVLLPRLSWNCPGQDRQRVD
jgi:hypothetical protein